ncbi:MAG: hypothetical protein Q4Q62_00670 [Thermoplasmata archaeon]|nr:hypothetical protein [Thermoplasmata archaeon]
MLRLYSYSPMVSFLMVTMPSCLSLRSSRATVPGSSRKEVDIICWLVSPRLRNMRILVECEYSTEGTQGARNLSLPVPDSLVSVIGRCKMRSRL